MLHGPTVPSCCLISFHFRWGKLSTRTVLIAPETSFPKLSYSRLYYTPMKLCKTIAIQSPCSMSCPTRICKLEVLLCLSIFYFWQTHCPHSINRLLPVDCTVPGRDPPENFPKRGAPSESPSYIVT